MNNVSVYFQMSKPNVYEHRNKPDDPEDRADPKHVIYATSCVSLSPLLKSTIESILERNLTVVRSVAEHLQ